MTTRAQRIQKSVVYKRASFHKEVAGKTLKSLLESALAAHTTVGKRRLNISESDNPVFHVVGTTKCEPTGFVFGALMTYTPGTDPLFLIDDDQAADVMLEKMQAPATDDGKRREILESMMYFGVIKNHLVLMQSQALKSPQLETYLRWLLHDSEVLEGSNTLHLVDTPSASVRKKMEQGQGVRTITVGGEVLPHTVFKAPAPLGEAVADQSPRGSRSKTHELSVVASTSEEDYGVLAALKKLMTPSQAAKIDFDKLAGSNIEMSVTLRYKRETTEEGQSLMDTLGVALRNTEDVQTELKLVTGGSIRGSELKLNGTVRLTSYDGQLSASEVYEELRQWLLSKVTSEELSAS